MIYLISPDERRQLRNAGDRMPLGILYLSTALEENGLETKVLDLNHKNTVKVLREIEREKPDVVGLSTMSPTARQMRILAQEVKKIGPRVIVGGIHATHRPHDFSDVADSVVQGYGEHAIFKALHQDGIHSTCFDIDACPIPNRKKLDQLDYNFKLEGLPATTMICSRGCPFNCAFCSNFDHKQKRRNLDNIDSEIEQVYWHGYRAVYLLDDSFTLNKEWAKSVTFRLRQKDLKYRIETRASLIDKDISKHLGRTGCLVVGMGIESGSNEILRQSQKRSSRRVISRAVKLLGKNGVKTKGFFIIGLPGETEETALQTLQFAEGLKKHGLDYADFYPLCPYPGSAVGDSPEQYGIEILEVDYAKYLNGGRELIVPTQTRDLPADKIRLLIEAGRTRWRR